MKKARNGEKKKRKFIKYIIIFLIIVAIIAGVVFFLKNRNKKEVSVYNIRDVGSENYWGNNENNSQGMVREDKMQAVYISSTQKPEKIMVKEGQTVKEGDVLLKYNTTLSSLELERKLLNIKKMEIELNKAKQELDRIKTYKPDVPIYGSLPTEPPALVEPPKTGHDELPNVTPPKPEVLPENEIKPAPITGEGTLEKPYMFVWEENKEYTNEFIEKLINRAGEGKTEVIAIFMIRENNAITGNLKSLSKIKFVKKDKENSFTILDMQKGDIEDPLYPNSKDETENDNSNNQEVVPQPEVGPIYTATELQKMIFEKEKQISETTLNIKIAKSEYNREKEELDNTTVYSKINGVVKTVLSIDDEAVSSKPIIVVSSGGGYYIQGRVSELSLDKIKVGQKVNVQAFESGTFAEGTVEEIEKYPISGSYWNGMGNSNVSYYPYTVRVDESANLKAGEYTNLTLVEENNIQEQGKNSTFYLTTPFVLSENGKYYVYIADENNKLAKREVKVGKNMHGLLEICGGISFNDKVAFPYGKNLKEGALVKESTVEELYSRNVERE